MIDPRRGCGETDKAVVTAEVVIIVASCLAFVHRVFLSFLVFDLARLCFTLGYESSSVRI